MLDIKNCREWQGWSAREYEAARGCMDCNRHLSSATAQAIAARYAKTARILLDHINGHSS